MNATVLEVLKESRELLAKPGGWCQGWYAYYTSDFGQPVRCYPGYEKAESFCLKGAVERAIYGVKPAGSNAEFARMPTTKAALHEKVWARLDKALLDSTLGQWSKLPMWNDTPGRTVEEVIALFDHAIEQETFFVKEGKEAFFVKEGKEAA